MSDTTGPVVVVSVDIETTGPSPAVASILSLGAVAYNNDDGVEVGEFYRTLEELQNPDGSGPQRDSGTMAWWATQPLEAWEAATVEAQPPGDVMADLVEWLHGLPGKPLFLAWPTGFDWSFVSYYLWRYAACNPFGYSPLCLKSFGAGLVCKAEAMLSSREEGYFPDYWIVEPEFPHHALHDARAQGEMWRRMMMHADEVSG